MRFEVGEKYVFSHRKFKKVMREKCAYIESARGVVFIADDEYGVIVNSMLLIPQWCTKLPRRGFK